MLNNTTSNKITCLDNNDVLLFLKDTYTVDRYKQLLIENIQAKFYQQISKDYYVKDIFKGISINGNYVKGGNILWNLSADGIECQLLKVGSKGWQLGRLKVSCSVEITPHENFKNQDRLKIDLVLEFCSDEAKEPESPLDDLRQMILSENEP
jgi:KGK domain